MKNWFPKCAYFKWAGEKCELYLDHNKDCGSIDCSAFPRMKRLRIQFPVRAHAQVVGSIPGPGSSRN